MKIQKDLKLADLLNKLEKYNLPSKHSYRSAKQLKERNALIKRIRYLPSYDLTFRPVLVEYPSYMPEGAFTYKNTMHLNNIQKVHLLNLIVDERDKLIEYQAYVTKVYPSKYLTLSIGALIGYTTQKINFINNSLGKQ